MSQRIWEASKKTKKNSELRAFEIFVSNKLNKNFKNSYQKLLNWSIKNYQDFWNIFWDFTKIKGLKGKKKLRNQKYFIRIFFYHNQN